jgi:hypothetical protein
VSENVLLFFRVSGAKEMCLKKGVVEFVWDSEKEGIVSAAEITPQYGYGFLEQALPMVQGMQRVIEHSGRRLHGCRDKKNKTVLCITWWWIWMRVLAERRFNNSYSEVRSREHKIDMTVFSVFQCAQLTILCVQLVSDNRT